MPWTKKDYPVSMKNLATPVRHKAIEIANALIEQGMKEGVAIASAISRAKDWAANRGKKRTNAKGSRVTDEKTHGKDVYVTPSEKGWALKEEGSEAASSFKTKRRAVQKGRAKARAVNGALTIQKKDGKLQKRISYNPNRKVARKASRKKPEKD